MGWGSHACQGAYHRPAGPPAPRTAFIAAPYNVDFAEHYLPGPIDPELDLFNPEHGPPYSEDFVARYREAQQARNRRITAWVEAELERVQAAGFPDRLFTLQRVWADPRMVDPALDPSDRPTPACYAGDPKHANRGVFNIGTLNTLRTWL